MGIAMTTLMLIDNGSRRADATRALRRMSQALSERIGATVHPVSLMHSSKVPVEELGGRPAEILEDFLHRKADQGEREFVAIPLFFGPSKALTKFIPETIEKVNQSGLRVEISVAPALCPLPRGEQRLVEILDRAIRQQIRQSGPRPDAPPLAVLVDHGSPIPEVSAVRHWLASRLAEGSGGVYEVTEAAMERRSGSQYDFNGVLLEHRLMEIGSSRGPGQVIVAMQFLGPGRHAGPGGDVETICQEAQRHYPEMRLSVTSLVGEDPQILDILTDRARSLSQSTAVDR